MKLQTRDSILACVSRHGGPLALWGHSAFRDTVGPSRFGAAQAEVDEKKVEKYKQKR